MSEDDSVIRTEAQKTIRGYSDGELLAFWAATETVQHAAGDISPREAALIELAAQELELRALVPA